MPFLKGMRSCHKLAQNNVRVQRIWEWQLIRLSHDITLTTRARNYTPASVIDRIFRISKNTANTCHLRSAKVVTVGNPFDLGNHLFSDDRLEFM